MPPAGAPNTPWVITGMRSCEVVTPKLPRPALSPRAVPQALGEEGADVGHRAGEVAAADARKQPPWLKDQSGVVLSLQGAGADGGDHTGAPWSTTPCCARQLVDEEGGRDA